MANKNVPNPNDKGVVELYQDMADGTFALRVVAMAAAIAAGTAGYPAGATPVAATGAGVNSTATATLPAAVGKTTYITGFVCTGAGATAGQLAGVALTGVVGAPLNYTIAVSTGPNVGNAPLVVSFIPPLPASALNSAIVVTVGAFGAGNVSSNVTATGFQL